MTSQTDATAQALVQPTARAYGPQEIYPLPKIVHDPHAPPEDTLSFLVTLSPAEPSFTFPVESGRVYFVAMQDIEGTIVFVHNDTPDGSVVRDIVRLEGDTYVLSLGPGRPLAFTPGAQPESHEHLFAPCYRPGISNACTPPVTIRWYRGPGSTLYIGPLLLWWTLYTDDVISETQPTKELLTCAPGHFKDVHAFNYISSWTKACAADARLDGLDVYPHELSEAAVPFRPSLASTRNVARDPENLRYEDARYHAFVEQLLEERNLFVMHGTTHDGQPFVRLSGIPDVDLDLPEMGRVLLPNPRDKDLTCTVRATRTGPHMYWDLLRCGYVGPHPNNMSTHILTFMGISTAYNLSALLTAARRCYPNPSSWNAIQQTARTTLPPVPRPVPCMLAVENKWIENSNIPDTLPLYYPIAVGGFYGRSTTQCANVRYCCGCGIIQNTRPEDCVESGDPQAWLYESLLALAHIPPNCVHEACVTQFKALTGRTTTKLWAVTPQHNIHRILAHFAAAFCLQCEMSALQRFCVAVVQLCGQVTGVSNVAERVVTPHDLPPLSQEYAALELSEHECQIWAHDAALYAQRPACTLTIATRHDIIMTCIAVDGAVTITNCARCACEPPEDHLCVSWQQGYVRAFKVLRQGAWWDLETQCYPIQRLAVMFYTHVRDPNPYRYNVVVGECHTQCMHLNREANGSALSVSGHQLRLYGIPIAERVSHRRKHNVMAGLTACIDKPELRINWGQHKVHNIVLNLVKQNYGGSLLVVMATKLYERMEILIPSPSRLRKPVAQFVADMTAWGTFPETTTAPRLNLLCILKEPSLYVQLANWALTCCPTNPPLLERMLTFTDTILTTQDRNKPVSVVAIKYMLELGCELNPQALANAPLPQWVRTQLLWVCTQDHENANTHICVICQNAFEEQPEALRALQHTLILTPCQHVLCPPCYAITMQKSPSPPCPLCRSPINTTPAN
ncbi:ORF109 [Ranid herpesvirus 1]|uniref:ORF109 n=1 Tax=Ranid herpesvirus 1 TaxID=85655 RepID=Q14VM1_9VIRU|nr:ORF109 [Ranid herpesvirus 1]ABG25712.1 ORF109 [Ranid herpesvirus 1]